MTSNSPPPLEHDIETECCDIAASEGCRSAKLDKINRSDPDRVFFLPFGKCWLVEFKRPGERPRRQQQHRHSEFHRIGHPVSLIDSVALFRQELNRRLEALHRD